MSKCPCPEKLKRITLSLPSFLASSASSMVALMAWEVSGAGMIPSVLANVTAASNQAF